MPDYFVPIDTSNFSVYYRDLINRGIFNQFILQHVDNNRNELKRKYPDFETYKKKFQAGEDLLEELVTFASSEGLEFSEEDWNTSKSQISMLMKGYVARDLFETGSFFEIYNESDPMFLKAVEILEDPEMHQAKLVKADD